MILDCLGAILRQKYTPIELIICDDCSQDNTVEVVEKWINLNKSCFYGVKFIKNKKNLGIVRNVENGISASSANQFFSISGDDMLGPNALTSAAQYFEENAGSLYFQGKAFYFDKINPDGTINVLGSTRKTGFFDLDAYDQYKKLMAFNEVCSPAVFFRKKFFDLVKTEHFDLKHLDDWPRWIVATSLGLPIRINENAVVFYRRHGGTIQANVRSSPGNAGRTTIELYEDGIKIRKTFQIPFFKSQFKLLNLLHTKQELLRLQWACQNKKIRRKYPLYRKFFGFIFDPLGLYWQIKQYLTAVAQMVKMRGKKE